MKLITFFVLAGIIHVSAAAHAQNEQMKLERGSMTVKQVLTEMMLQHQYDIFYSDDLVDTRQIVEITQTTVSVDELLKTMLEGKYAYEVLGKTIIIKPLNPSSQEQKTVTITGTVRDERGDLLPGVTVMVKGTTLGVSTDVNGKFTLQVASGEGVVLLFSFIGMESQEVAYTGKELRVVLKEIVSQVEEVVVTGIFTRRKEGFTGSANTITSEEIMKVSSTNVLRALEMLDPGFRMNVSNFAGSNPNALPDFEMRGQSNMGDYSADDVVVMRGDIDTRPNQPLFVLDGIIGVGVSTIIDLDPARIESITILKDAAAMVIYGSRASNGVVVVETKAPAMGKLRFSYNGNYKLQLPDLSVYNLLNAADKLELERQAGFYDEYYTSENATNLNNYYLAKYLDVLRGVDTYWLAEPVREAFNHRHGLSLEGGDHIFRYKLYFGADFTPGVMKGTGYDKKSASLDVRYRNEKLLVSNQVAVDYTVGDRSSPYGTFKEYTYLNAYYPKYDEHGNYVKVLDNYIYQRNGGNASYIGENSYSASPLMNPAYNIRFFQKDESTNFQLRNMFKVEYMPIPNLRLAADITLTRTNEEVDVFVPSNHTSYEGVSVEYKGNYRWTRTNNTNYNISFTASYNKMFNENHLLSLFGRYEVDERVSHTANISMRGFPNDKMDEVFLGTANNYVTGNEGTTRSLGFVGTANYSYRQTYAFDASVRVDASSEFGRNNRFAPFWSVGARWNMDKESWLKSTPFVDELVLRCTYGITGSQGFSPYQSLQMYTYEGSMVQYHSSPTVGTLLQSIGNPDLKWQQTRNFNLGLDFNIWKRILSGRVEYYDKRTINTLLAFSLAPSVGFETITDNMGDISNKGYEFSLRVMPYNNVARQFNVSLTVNGSHNVNRIERISNALKVRNQEAAERVTSTPLPQYVEGYSQSIIWAVKSLGIDPISGKEVFRKRDGGTTMDWSSIDQVPVGDTEPTLRGTLGLNVNWRGFSLNLAGNYRFGGQLYNRTLLDKVENADLKKNVDARAFTERWKEPGDVTFFKGITKSANGQSTKASSRFVMDDNELMLSSLTLQYRMEQRTNDFIKKLGISSATVGFYLEDLVRLSTIKMERGIDYPFAHQISMSLNVVF